MSVTVLRLRGGAALVAAALAALLTAAACAAPAAPTGEPAAPAAETADTVTPVIARWTDAWNHNQPSDRAALYTEDAVYTDRAFQETWTGQDQIAQWTTVAHGLISDMHADVEHAFRSGDDVAVTWTFSGRVRGAPKPFAVPVTTILHLRGDRIAAGSDSYNLAALVRQSGLPADWTPAGR